METNYSTEALRERAQRIAHALQLSKFAVDTETKFYSDLSESLRRYSDDKVQNFLKQFYGRSGGEKEDYFPNGGDLGAYMGRIFNTRWLQPSKNYSNKKLQTFVNEITKAFKIRNLEALTTTDFDAAWDVSLDVARYAAQDAAWGVAQDAARGAALGVARNASWNASWNAARDAAWGVARGAALDAARGAARGAEYIIVQDLINKEYPKNPFGKLISVYELGLWPAGISENKFLIWHPKVVKKS
jgi:hypothetical protein